VNDLSILPTILALLVEILPQNLEKVVFFGSTLSRLFSFPAASFRSERIDISQIVLRGLDTLKLVAWGNEPILSSITQIGDSMSDSAYHHNSLHKALDLEI
jgi:hypothetical protein